MMLRGRQIAYQAANSPTIPSSMPNYTHDQIRELYGELAKKKHRSQENTCIFQIPMIDAWKENSSWNLSSSIMKNQQSEECPLPEFRIDSDPTIFMGTYLSTGLSNPRTPLRTSMDAINDKQTIRGSFRTSIADRTTISPSPRLFNIHFDFNKFPATSINKKEQSMLSEDIQQETLYNSDQQYLIEKKFRTMGTILPSIDSHIIYPDSSEEHLYEESVPFLNNVCLMNHQLHFVKCNLRKVLDRDVREQKYEKRFVRIKIKNLNFLRLILLIKARFRKKITKRK